MTSQQVAPRVEYYFSAISSFAYLGHGAFQEMAVRLNLDVDYKPVQLGAIFANSGGLAFKDRHPARNRNRMLELQRWRDYRGLEMNLQPKYFPTDPTLADCAIISVQKMGENPAALMEAIMRKIWIEEANIAERQTVADCLTAVGFDAEAVLGLAVAEEALAQYEANTKAGLETDIIGSPCVVYQGEPFWGQDRFMLVEQAITSSRPAYSGTP